MKTTSEILSEHAAKANNNAIFDYADSWINGAMQEFADQEKAALKEKLLKELDQAARNIVNEKYDGAFFWMKNVIESL